VIRPGAIHRPLNAPPALLSTTDTKNTTSTKKNTTNFALWSFLVLVVFFVFVVPEAVGPVSA
jgi:hypothetical protein